MKSRRRARQAATPLLLLAVVLWFVSPGCSSHEGAVPGGGVAAPTALTASLRMAVVRARQKAPGYDFVSDASGTLRTRAGGYGAKAEVAATERGVRLEGGGDGGFHLGVETTRVGRGTSPASLGVRGQRAEGQELVLDRGDDVEERYLAGPLGVEQSYVVGARPDGRGPLSIEVAFDGLLPERVEGATDQVLLRDESGLVRAGYRDLAAVDAEGRELATRMEVRDAGVALVIDDTGAAYPLRVDPVVWVQQAELTASDGAWGDELAISVAVSGGTAIVGAGYHTVGSNVAQGAAYVFVRGGTTWTQQAELTASDGAPGDFFGWSVAVSGGTAIVGAWRHTLGSNDYQGVAYVFVQSGTAWSQQAELTASDGAPGDFFGWSVAVSGGTAIVAARQHQVGSNPYQGAAYVFVQSGTTWSQQAELSASNGAAYDEFGNSVAVSGGTAIVGACYHNVGNNYYQGAAYVFVQSGTTWSQQAELMASDGAEGDFFGISVAVSGGTAIVGAANHAVGGNHGQGAAYIFVQSGATWGQQAELVASDGAANDEFGNSVAVSGDTAVVGAFGRQVGGNGYQGAAYVFMQSGTIWSLEAELVASDGAANDEFGGSVAVSGGTTIVGAADHTVGNNPQQGAADVFVSGGNGTTCTITSAAICLSGNCVDGVCCDTTCGGGVATDCQSCLGAMTGGKDGTCGTVTAGAMYTCRASTGACDLAAVCTGLSTACPADKPQPNGTACNDGNACTQTDVCMNGACTGSTPATCTASDACHVAGTCDPSTGTCSNPQANDGTACDDGNACTQTDVCTSGVCTGTNPVVCTASDECHDVGSCDAPMGTCSNPAKADGTACSMGVCMNGTCTPQGSGGAGGGGVTMGGRPSGCGCSTPGGDSAPGAWLGLGLGLLVLARRKPRSERSVRFPGSATR